jgi:hypothetical protein
VKQKRIEPSFFLFSVFFGFLISLYPLYGQTRIHEVIKGDTFEDIEGRGLVIRTEPSGARVFIDGVERGLTPFTLDTIAPGEYSVRLVKDDYVERRFTIRISASSRHIVSIELMKSRGRVYVSVYPAPGSPPPNILPLNPDVFVDGEAAALPLLDLGVGNKTITIRAFGWEDASRAVYVRPGLTSCVEMFMYPAPFTISAAVLSRRRFNPANSGELGYTELRFEASAPGRARITVRDSGGRPVFSAELPPFTSRRQSVVWNGRDAQGRILPDDTYSVIVEAESLPRAAGEPEKQNLSLQTIIDSSVVIYPLSLAASVPGLIFAPVPENLPKGSFQIEGVLYFGAVSEGSKAFSSLPFEMDMRFSPLDRLEFSAGLGVVPVFGDGMGWAAGGSAKWLILRSRSVFPLEMASAASCFWTQKPLESPQRAGTSLYLPMSLGLGRFFSVLLSPGVFWAGFDEPVPRLVLSGGLLFRHSWFSAGLSLRPEFNISGRTKPDPDNSPVTLQSAVELKLYPPPSNLVYTLFGGLTAHGSYRGGFGGVGIGIIY